MGCNLKANNVVSEPPPVENHCTDSLTRSVCSVGSNPSLVICSVSEGAGTLSSIVCRTAAGAGVGQVPLKVVIDEFEVLTPKMFMYKKNPVIKSVKPLCSLQR